MPNYDYECQACGRAEERFLPMARFDERQYCVCGSAMIKNLSAPRINGDYEGYSCPVTGKWVEGRKAHEENLKRTGCRVLEEGERGDVARRNKESERQLDQLAETMAVEGINAMPERKFQALAAELEKGADAPLVRR